MMVLSSSHTVYDAENKTVIQLRACEGRTGTGVRTAAAALALAILIAGGCDPDGGTAESGAPATTGSSGAPSMTEQDYITHIAALTIAVEEELSGEDAASRAIELGSRGHSRKEVEGFARALRSRPKTWLEIEREVDRRVGELRSAAGGSAGGAEGR